ncbi:hypothetical protein LSM04_008988 [Trypanosoma melophagium]|uniref:uncharacterized protein n=1 Tax=Trypanosoma melophagium TaxID=715481 RepID=UPI003519F0A9|nr:hypothetical protein LSM04_008988 [Trypanosoma melophagium]
MSGCTLTPHTSPPLLLPSATTIATTVATPVLVSATALSNYSSSSSSSSTSSHVRRRRSKEISFPRNGQITQQDGPWYCICGTVCATSSTFFMHSRDCSLRKGTASLEKNTSEEEEPPTVREEMFLSLQEALASDKLVGDSLAAAVQAIQSTREEEKEETHTGGSWRLMKTFLPVSGSALIAAASGLACTDSGNNNEDGKVRTNSEVNRKVASYEKEGTTDGNESKTCSSPYYTVLPEGLPVSNRIKITRTYRNRAAFVVLDEKVNPVPQSREYVEDNTLPQQHSSSRSSSIPVPRDFPALQFNMTHSDMSFYVYKRFLPRDDSRWEQNDDAKDIDDSNNSNNSNNGDDESRAKKCKMELPCMDTVLRQERRRIARVPMPVIEWNYPK